MAKDLAIAQKVSPTLQKLFVAHFIADMAFAIPLMFAPEATLTWLGWKTIDPVATRLVAAALFGIGIQSWLGRKESPDAYRGMLNLKLIWSATAVGGLLLSLSQGAPAATGTFAGIYAIFFGIWAYWRKRLA